MLADDLATALAAAPGSTAAELIARLPAGAESCEREVSFALFAGHDRFRCDRASPPRWQLVGPGTGAGTHLEPACGSVGPPRAGLAGDRDRERGRGPAAVGGPNPLPPGPSQLSLYAWQVEALMAWRRQGSRGVVEAVTGTGKTMVGMAAALAELAWRGQVLVLVPTVELAHQWARELDRCLALAGYHETRVGQLGDGSKDSLATHDVLVAVVNSARSVDVRPIRAGGLLVADECHRYGSAINHLALDPRFLRRLGLSATYAREDDGNLDWLDPYFGGTCFRLGYRRAVDEGVTARFSATFVGVEISGEERACYDELSRQMRCLRARLVDGYGVPEEPFEAFMRAIGRLADGDGGDAGGAGSGLARAYRQAMLERRRLLADTPAKQTALAALAPAIVASDRTIVFTQSIAGAERAHGTLVTSGLRAGLVHSRLASSSRRDVLEHFARGRLDVICAPRVLDEGVDVPAADLAVIVGASRSRRQMVQRMGRVLRRKASGRRARLAVVFAEETVEDPRWGAHEAFLGEVTGVADHAYLLTARVVASRPEALLRALRPTRVPQEATGGTSQQAPRH